MVVGVQFISTSSSYFRRELFAVIGGDFRTWIGVKWFQGAWLFGDLEKVDASTFGWNIGEPNRIELELCVENWRGGVAMNNLRCQLKRQVLCEKKSE